MPVKHWKCIVLLISFSGASALLPPLDPSAYVAQAKKALANATSSSGNNPLASIINEIPGLAAKVEEALEQEAVEAAAYLLLQPAPEHYWSYGRSPPVYPSRKSTGSSKTF